ncbi:hypothetical protein EPK99_03270 [Neorhizobium lilium]|uniref:Uncharacterized protein n=1 Tax=Neorhizobium lilium TaxID=2503024 RepID=A0A3S3SAW1_9HYPH|nr:hypothetical protein [Neorhizobium lilium]RWX81345.1 hypothetical protein EPK99_03270 [Neorhizobium lilium]
MAVALVDAVSRRIRDIHAKDAGWERHPVKKKGIENRCLEFEGQNLQRGTAASPGTAGPSASAISLLSRLGRRKKGTEFSICRRKRMVFAIRLRAQTVMPLL